MLLSPANSVGRASPWFRTCAIGKKSSSQVLHANNKAIAPQAMSSRSSSLLIQFGLRSQVLRVRRRCEKLFCLLDFGGDFIAGILRTVGRQQTLVSGQL